MKRLGIIGARGYTGAELMKLISHHPNLSIVAVSSRQLKGTKVSEVCPTLPDKTLTFCDVAPGEMPAFSRENGVDAWVLALPNGLAGGYVKEMERAGLVRPGQGKDGRGGAESPVIVDLSADFRFDADWVYGFPERNRGLIKGARLIANPGCYATAAQASILPFGGLLAGPPTVFGVSGYSGAGTNPSDKNDPVRLHDNLMAYSLVDHMHEREVSRQVGRQIHFTPHVAPFFQGIHLTTVLQLERPLSKDEAVGMASEYFKGESLVRVGKAIPEVRDIMNKHHVMLGGFEPHPGTNRLVVVATIDNLLKGAATQCLQNLNLALGLDELAGIDVVRGANALPGSQALVKDADTEAERTKKLIPPPLPPSSSSAPAPRGPASSAEIVAAADAAFIPTYKRFPLVIEAGNGSTLITPEGERYVDMFSGIAVSAVGHNHPHVVRALAQQAGKIIHTSNMVYNPPATLLAQRLAAIAPFPNAKVFLASTGCEANEGALKFALLHGQAVSPSKVNIVAFDHSFHGRTLGALSITEKAVYRAPFDPYLPGGPEKVRPDSQRFASYNDLESARRLINKDTAAVFVEPVQGEGGVRPGTLEFLSGLRKLCDEHNALLIFDEVQIGLARSGELFASSAYGVTPDIMTLAKPLAGGLPVAAILSNPRGIAKVTPGIHGTTFGGSPIGAATANAVLDIILTPEFLQGVRMRSQHAMERLRAIKSSKVKEVRGLGLLIGIQLNCPAGPVIDAARAKGVIIISAGDDVIRLAPPLNIPYDDLDKAIKVIESILKDE